MSKYVASFCFRSGEENRAVVHDRIRALITTHPELSLIIDTLSTAQVPEDLPYPDLRLLLPGEDYVKFLEEIGWDETARIGLIEFIKAKVHNEHLFRTTIDEAREVLGAGMETIGEAHLRVVAQKQDEITRIEAERDHLKAKLANAEEHIAQGQARQLEQAEELQRQVREFKQKFEDVRLQLEKLAQHKKIEDARAAEALMSAIDAGKKIEEKSQQLEKQVSYRDGVIDSLKDRIWRLEKDIEPGQVARQAELEFWRSKAIELMKKS